MAFQFTTGTINQPDAGSVGLAMVEKMRDDIVAHAAWDLVEEYYPATGAVRWYVFKCLASQSGLAADYFVIIGRTLGDGSLRLFLAEAYNSSTHVVSKYCPAGSTSPQFVFDSLGRLPDANTYTLALVQLPSGSVLSPVSNIVWAPSGTSTKWWLIVTDDGFTVAFNGASNGFFHVGAYLPVTVATMLLPIHAWSHANVGHLTRNPVVAGVNYYGTSLWTTHTGSVDAPALGFSGDLRYNDALQGNGRLVAEQGFTIQQNIGAASQYPITGWGLGRVKRMRYNALGQLPVGVAFGDGYVLSNRLWVPYLPTDVHMWDTGVAA